MRATAFARNTFASSFSKQLHRVLLLSALLAIASVSSLAQITVSPASLTFAAQLIDTTSAAKSVTITNKGAATIDDNSNNLLAFVGLSGTGQAPVTAAPATVAFTGGTVGTISAAKTF